MFPASGPYRENWRDPVAYRFPRASALRWAWEYLRRNPEYCDDYRKFAPLHQDAARWREKHAAACERARAAGGQIPPVSKTAFLSYRAETKATGQMAARFDVLNVTRPESAKPPRFTTAVPAFADAITGVPCSPSPPQQHQVWVSLDLRYPLSWQLPGVEPIFEQLRRFAKEQGIDVAAFHDRQPDRLALGLRILDADAAGATTNTVAGLLYSGIKRRDAQQKLSKDRKTALALRDHGYRLLAAQVKAKPRRNF